MDLQQTGLGIVLFLVFWAFQAGYFSSLGTTAWVVGVVIFSVILWLIGKGVMKKASADYTELWNFVIAFAVVSQVIISYLGSSLGAVVPAGFTADQLTPLVLSFWLVLFGAAMFVTGWWMKWGVTAAVGIIWLLSSVHFVAALSTGPNSYLHFGLVTALPFIIYGLMRKD